jgi:hypothetical protein
MEHAGPKSLATPIAIIEALSINEEYTRWRKVARRQG